MHVVGGMERQFILLVTRQNGLDELEDSVRYRLQRLRRLLRESEPPKTSEVDLVDDSTVDRIDQTMVSPVLKIRQQRLSTV